MGNWNLRTDFAHPKSFEHKANGYGIVSQAGMDFALGRSWTARADLGYRYWTTEAGTDKTFFANGTNTVTTFNGANLESYSVMLGLVCRF